MCQNLNKRFISFLSDCFALAAVNSCKINNFIIEFYRFGCGPNLLSVPDGGTVTILRDEARANLLQSHSRLNGEGAWEAAGHDFVSWQGVCGRQHGGGHWGAETVCAGSEDSSRFMPENRGFVERFSGRGRFCMLFSHCVVRSFFCDGHRRRRQYR